MFAALLTAFFFAVSAVLARRSTELLGSQRANLARQLFALILLGLWAHTFGQGLSGPTFAIFFMSGVVGFGMGDWALFETYTRLGPALAVLMCQCLAAPFAAFTEWLWLGTTMSPIQLASSAVTLIGVALAVAPEKDSVVPHGHRVAGIGFGLVAAVGQGGGAVLSRYAYHRADAIHFHLDGMTTAYQRLWGGVLFITLVLLMRRLTSRHNSPAASPFLPDWRRGYPWVIGNALAGATVGVSCYQWALHTTPSAIVLPIVATTPLVVMLMVFAFEGARPTRRAIAGSFLAVAGVVALILTHQLEISE
jgi:drug/metabolite transporter (DMT)-like permease